MLDNNATLSMNEPLPTYKLYSTNGKTSKLYNFSSTKSDSFHSEACQICHNKVNFKWFLGSNVSLETVRAEHKSKKTSISLWSEEIYYIL